MRSLSSTLIGIGLFASLTLGCSAKGPRPSRSPAAEHAAYATEYPARLKGATARYDVEEHGAEQIGSDMPKFPEQLKRPDWSVARRVYELADEDGKNSHFAEVREKNAEIAQFFVTEKDELVRKAGGAVQHQAKEDGCKGDYYGAVSRGLEKALEQRLKERSDAASEAQRYLEQEGSDLLPADRSTLSSQTAAISLASYTVHVALPERHAELEKLVDEASAVKRTLKRRQETLAKVPPEAGSSAAKKSRKDELQALSAAVAQLDAVQEPAKKRLETSEAAIDAARGKYKAAWKKLMDVVRDKEEAEADGKAEAASKAAAAQ